MMLCALPNPLHAVYVKLLGVGHQIMCWQFSPFFTHYVAVIPHCVVRKHSISQFQKLVFGKIWENIIFKNRKKKLLHLSYNKLVEFGKYSFHQSCSQDHINQDQVKAQTKAGQVQDETNTGSQQILYLMMQAISCPQKRSKQSKEYS